MLNRQTAFTLIEITIALLVLAVGLVGILALFPVGFDAVSRAANITQATLLAQGVMEDLKREGYDGSTVIAAFHDIVCWSGPPLGPSDPSYVAFSDLFPGFPNFEYELITSTVPASGYDPTPVPNLRRAIIRVYWPAEAGTAGDRGAQRCVELSVYLAKYGITP